MHSYGWTKTIVSLIYSSYISDLKGCLVIMVSFGSFLADLCKLNGMWLNGTWRTRSPGRGLGG